MVTYVFSDVHGHLAPLQRLFERVAPSADDTIFMLGDMVDRGPDPVGVMRFCHDLPGAHVLMGNHEDLMMSYMHAQNDPVARMNWEINGSGPTMAGLQALDAMVRDELLDWVGSLPVSALAQVGERPYILVHAGIRSEGLKPRPAWTLDDLRQLIAEQDIEDLLWIREEFWGAPTGLLDSEGKGPIVIAGHTPTVYLEGMADVLERSPRDENGLCRQVKVGAVPATSMVADRWDIDSGAAGGAGFGQVSMVRLEDGEEFYEPIREGE